MSFLQAPQLTQGTQLPPFSIKGAVGGAIIGLVIAAIVRGLVAIAISIEKSLEHIATALEER